MSYDETKLARIPTILQSPSKFVDDLPRVSRADLPDSEYDRKCTICHEDFKTVDQEVNGEQAVKLSCGHVFGKDCLLDNEVETKCTHFLLWVVRKYRHRGAALDRLYQLIEAVSQARKVLLGFENWCNHENGGLSTLDYRYMHLLEQIAYIDIDDSHCPSEIIEEVHDRFDQIMMEYKEQPYRRAPLPPMIGRRPRILNIRHERDVFEGLDCELGDRTSMSSSLPLWVCNLFEQDFADIPRDELFDELRSRRFAYPVRYGLLPLPLLTQLTASQVDDETIEEYTRAHTAVGDRSRQPEYQFMMNRASDTLQYMWVG